jgi:uncharacterized protein YrrD
MLYKAKAVEGYRLDSYDGEIGTVVEFYFDDRHWVIRYLIADTGDWLVDRKVLISPYALVDVSQAERHIAINLTKKQIEQSPLLNSNKPVSLQFEQEYYGYYEWPMYWAGPFMWGAYPYIVRDSSNDKETSPEEKGWDPHLRSTHEVSGYHIQAADGELGHVEDFIIDDETWAIRYLVINTHNWWPGKKVLISPLWITRVCWTEAKVFVRLPREIIRQSPEYTDESLVTRDYEHDLNQYYHRRGYWAD